jgi:sterol desaturase/sphingolipid hydroxylase (fatty acid hydroxylase superfamily)
MTSFIFDYFTFKFKNSHNKFQLYSNSTTMHKLWIFALKISMCNYILAFPLVICFCEYMENRFIRDYTAYNMVSGCIKLFFYMYISRIYFYFSHYVLNKINFLYKNIHKLHHTWTKPFAITTIACHPIEFVFSNVITVALPIILFPDIHIIYIYLYLIISIINSIMTHCGWRTVTNGFHDKHHEKFNCNYGIDDIPYLKLDKLFGTEYINKKIS